MEDCTGTVINICWSKNGHHMLVSAADKSLTLLGITKCANIARTTLLQAALKAHLHPISSTPSLCLVCPIASPPMIIDMLAKTEKNLPISIRNDVDPSDISHTPTCFNKYGDLIYVGNLKGEILIIDHKRIEIRGVISIPGNDVIKNLVFSRNGQHLLTNLDYKTIRIYNNLLPSKDWLKALDKLHQESDGDEKSRVVGRRCLALSCEIKDTESDVKWRAPCFSGNGEWIVGGSTERLTHKMYIWDREGSVVRILEGPKDAVMDIVWHPVKPIIVSVSLAGTAYIWGKEYVSNWSAPYMEIDQNEYVEGEDEFDTVPDEVEEEEEDVGGISSLRGTT